MFHFMSSLVTWDVVILELIILRMHVWLLDFYREILHFESNILQKNRVWVSVISKVGFLRWTYHHSKDKKVMYPCPYWVAYIAINWIVAINYQLYRFVCLCTWLLIKLFHTFLEGAMPYSSQVKSWNSA